jgi:plastocyanin
LAGWWTAAGVVAVFATPAMAAAAAVEVRVEQRDGAPLADVVVAALPLAGGPLAPPAPAVMDQRDRRFVPQILVVQRGARVAFANSDSVSHHVYSFSPVQRLQLFLPKGEPPPAIDFEHAGVVTLGCNLHDWMLGYIAIVDTPYFTKTDAAGAARLRDLPAGRYRLELWHPRVTDSDERLRHEVDLGAAAAPPWRLRLEQPLLPSREQEPAFQEYGGGG